MEKQATHRMRRDLDHLPDLQRRELELALRVLFESFAEAIGERATQEHKRKGAILKVVLFGSIARGQGVEDRGSGYMSDYDLLVVVNDDRLTERNGYWDGAADRFVRELTIVRSLQRPVNFIVHSLKDVNHQLQRGRPFFLDVVRDGILLYEAPGHSLEQPRRLPPEEERREAQADYNQWFPTAASFFKNAGYAKIDGEAPLAAFLLHQATERLYHCVLLVLTLYSPKSHKLDVLRSLAEDLDQRLRAAWPREDRASRRGFDRIRRAYVEARYSSHYTISPDELAFAFDHVAQLQRLVEEVCRERLEKGPGPSGGAETVGA